VAPRPKVQYAHRKQFANTRPRVGGRFVTLKTDKPLHPRDDESVFPSMRSVMESSSL